jgi:hypothetical protein
VDPVSRRTQPLTAAPPGITPNGVALLPTTMGLWVAGLDRNGRPSVAVSHDDGASWSVHSFGSVPAPARLN